MIHSSAVIAGNSIIEKGAIIGANVRIGPFCHIQSNVEIGEGTIVLSHGVINGHTRIGRDNFIDRFCSLGEINQDLKYRNEPTRLEIGHRNQIGQKATFHRGTVQGSGVTTIGDDNIFLNQVHIGHDCVVGNAVEIGLGGVLAGHVEVDNQVCLGKLAAVHQFCILGRACEVLAGSCVVQDVPPFVLAEGNRCRPIEVNEAALLRWVEDPHLRLIIRQLYQRMYHCAEPIEDVREEIAHQQQEYSMLVCFEHFFARSKRGIIR
ncbi:acyl-ACP--UDP-N-acetylglucosamine O-acyltransferase [Rouxiella sp. S1S-2]|uniref:acyl-ACP--UDP-N-acetylglucosamine O-acyltransferase n=1 Tax=Rouxiella sp. S1S-2 TaxID=2653856 RepID=UPI001264C8B4|nr:acyl-ACP--UDP-N-acetylglucosamine O-acyltransferase [Rouxiella sp. S1S-2]KAB7897272.1 acyl-ACP--UDP-N-acetylglucosamine O-acyltransferase [Rouxiella sp. S1S-2]